MGDVEDPGRRPRTRWPRNAQQVTLADLAGLHPLDRRCHVRGEAGTTAPTNRVGRCLPSPDQHLVVRGHRHALTARVPVDLDQRFVHVVSERPRDRADRARVGSNLVADGDVADLLVAVSRPDERVAVQTPPARTDPDAGVAGVTDEVPGDQEVGREPHVVDDLEFVGHPLDDRRRQIVSQRLRAPSHVR